MRILFILLALVAVSKSTTSYSCYGYRRCLVYPKKQIYCYNIHYKSSWCSYKYYEPVLHVYPGDDCGKDGWTEKTVADLQVEMENLLKEALLKISQKMTQYKLEFAAKLTENANSYKEMVKNKLTNYYAYYIECAKAEEEKERLPTRKRNDAIKKYNEEIDAKVTAATEKCAADILAKIKCITDYHAKLVENGVKCLGQRNTKISEYANALVEKCKGYVTKFTEYHMAILEQKKTYYRSSLDKVHGSPDWNKDCVDQVMVYHDQEVAKINVLVIEYAKKLVAYKLKLISSYTCSYRCYMSNSKLRFYKRSYYSSCKRLGCWYRYKSTYCIVKRSLCPFTYVYKPVNYCGLKTCVFPAVVRDGSTIITEFEAKLEKSIEEYVAKFAAWKVKWTAYHIEYSEKYDEIMKARHDWYIGYLRSQYICANNNSELTSEQEAKIAEVKEELDAKRSAAVLAYKTKLVDLILECAAKFAKSVEDYKTKVKAYIKKLADDFDERLAKRVADIAEYKKKLGERATAETEKLKEAIFKAKGAHLKRYIDMLKMYHDDTLPDDVNKMYILYAKLLGYCNEIVAKSTTHWTELIPKLVLHYSCCYVVKEPVCRFPTYCFGGYYTWSVKYPTASCYKYHYNYYRKCRSYRVSYCRGYYSYC
uniref:Uncharacterized protein n=1 Tax=Ciona savignyi TaxID=51511 RepID=H2YLM1_CIOSA